MPHDRRSPIHAHQSLQHLQRVGEHNADPLARAAKLLSGCLTADGLILTAGAGHSLGGVLESFYRAGGLAAVRPLYHPDLLPLHGALASTDAERRSGLAGEVLADAGFCGERDLLVVFSNSGSNPYPVELAATASSAGSDVLAITSSAAAASAPRRAGSTLAEHATVVLDTLVPPGDTSYPEEQRVTAPLSSLSNVFLWNLLLAEVFETASTQQDALPVWQSTNVAGGDEANTTHLETYRPRIPEL